MYTKGINTLGKVMTKKKALIYLLIFLILICATSIWNYFYLKNPTDKFPDECKMVIAPSCQMYLNKLSKEKKYEDAVKIQKVRISENEKILAFYKFKMKNKFLLFKSSEEAEKELLACINETNCKRDYFLLKACDFTLRDIAIDSMLVAEIELKELQDRKAALKTLKHAEKLIKKNKYFFAKDSAINAIDIQIAQIDPIKQKKK